MEIYNTLISEENKDIEIICNNETYNVNSILLFTYSDMFKQLYSQYKTKTIEAKFLPYFDIFIRFIYDQKFLFDNSKEIDISYLKYLKDFEYYLPNNKLLLEYINKVVTYENIINDKIDTQDFEYIMQEFNKNNIHNIMEVYNVLKTKDYININDQDKYVSVIDNTITYKILSHICDKIYITHDYKTPNNMNLIITKPVIPIKICVISKGFHIELYDKNVNIVYLPDNEYIIYYEEKELQLLNSIGSFFNSVAQTVSTSDDDEF